MVRNVSVEEKIHEAVWYFHHPDYGYNCAQSIAKHYGSRKHEIEEMAARGSGKALHGYCGALHAGLQLLPKNSIAAKKLIQKFSEQTGSPYCREIRKKKQANCRQCVEITDKFLKNAFTNYPEL